MHSQLEHPEAVTPRRRGRRLAAAIAGLGAIALSGGAAALALPADRADYPGYPTNPTSTTTTGEPTPTTTNPPGPTGTTPAASNPAPAGGSTLPAPQLLGPRNLGAARVDRSGRFAIPRFRLICPLSSSSCTIVANDRGTLTNGQFSRTRHPTIANRHFVMRPGTQTHVTMRLQRGAMAALRHRRRLRTTLSISASDRGHDVHRTYHLRLRPR